MSEFLTRGVPASTEPGPPAEGNIFSGGQWGGPDSWDGPVWSEKYKKYITKKDQEFDEAAEAVAKRNADHHNDDLHKSNCPCSVPSHHASYITDIKRRIEPLTETINNLEQQIDHLSTQIPKSAPSTTEEGAPAGGHDNKAVLATVTTLKAHVHDVAQKMHAIIKNADKSVRRLGEIDQGSKDEVGHLYRTEQPK